MSGIEIPTIEDVRSAFGIKDAETPPDQTETQTETPPADTEDQTDDTSTETEGEGAGDQGEETPPDPEELLRGGKSKDNAAFAEMRIQNKKQQAVLSGVAEVLGLDLKSVGPDQIVDAVRAVLTQAQAKATGLDPNTLIELESLRELNSTLKAQTNFANAQQQIKDIQAKFEIPGAEIVELINQIKTDHPDFDPEVDSIDYEAEYQRRFQQRIVDRAVAKALADNAKLQANNNRAPGMPPGKGTAPDTKQKPITTVKGLDAFLNNLEL